MKKRMNNSDDAAGEDKRASASEAWLGSRRKQARGIQNKMTMCLLNAYEMSARGA